MSTNLVLVQGSRWVRYIGGKSDVIVDYDEDAEEYVSTHEVIEEFRTGAIQIDTEPDTA